MPCTCSVCQLPGFAPPVSAAAQPAAAGPHLSSSDSNGTAHPPPPSSPPPPLQPLRCFHCLCTVCGLDLAGVPTVMCEWCGSRTHLTCARDVFSREWLCKEVATPRAAVSGLPCGVTATTTSADNATTTAAPGRKRQRSSSAVDTGVPAPAIVSTATSPSCLSLSASSLGRDASSAVLPPPPAVSMPSAQALRAAAARLDKSYKFYCHPDCAMGVEVVRNSQFSRTLSRRVEAAFAVEWARVRESLASAGVLPPAKHEAADPQSAIAALLHRVAPTEAVKGEPLQLDVRANVFIEDSASANGLPRPQHSGMPSLIDLDADTTPPAVVQEVLRLFYQLRAEAWADYFEQERHHVGHPLFYPPPFLDIAREAVVGHVMEAASPHGQAARLYLFDPATHAVGSVVAVPAGVLARWQKPPAPPSTAPIIRENDSNNFVAESLERVVADAEVPEMAVVYH